MRERCCATLPLWLTAGSWAAAWAVACALLAAVVVFVIRSAREHRRNRELMSRLDELESRIADDAASPTTITPSMSRVPERFVPTPSGDVLAGRTTDVERLVNGRGTVPRSLAEQAILAVHGRIGDALAPVELAADLRVSLRTLERGLSMCLDCTPRQLILAMRMREARRMLAGGEYLVKQVAHHLGFTDPYHFSRCFKSFYHVAPSAARPQQRSV